MINGIYTTFKGFWIILTVVKLWPLKENIAISFLVVMKNIFENNIVKFKYVLSQLEQMYKMRIIDGWEAERKKFVTKMDTLVELRFLCMEKRNESYLQW